MMVELLQAGNAARFAVESIAVPSRTCPRHNTVNQTLSLRGTVPFLANFDRNTTEHRYRFALQDVRTVLTMPQDKVGSANLSLANGMQHRLNRVVQQLKNAS